MPAASASASVSPDGSAAPSRAGTPGLRQAGPWAPKAESSQQAHGPSRASRGAALDPLSDQATQALIRCTLCPQQSRDKARHLQAPIHELLPPLTSQNDIDLELYALLAIILRQFVQSWYATITTEESFVAEILHLVAHCSRALEQRLRNLDLESLLFDELPTVLDQHIQAYRAAHGSVPQSPLVVDPRQAYHALWPLPFLSPVPRPDDVATEAEQQRNESAYRQLLVQAILAVLLPTEDLENPCLTALVSQILSELVIGDMVIQKVAQPWFLFEGICLLARVSGEEARTSSPAVRRPQESTGWRRPWSVPACLVALIQLTVKALSSFWLLIETLLMSFLPSRCCHGTEFEIVASHEARSSSSRASRQAKVPVLDFAAWRCASSLLELPSRMPWLSGFLALLQLGVVHGPGRIAGLNGLLDRFLSHHIQAALTPSCLSGALRALRGTVFPNNAPGVSSLHAPSSDNELRALRARAAKALWNLVPKAIGRVYFGGAGWWAWRRRGHDKKADAGADEEQRMVDEVEQLLMVLSDEYCNKHLFYSMLELLIVRLIPELVDKGVAEPWEERLG